MSKRPRLNYLRAFDAASRKLSFSLAAEELNLTQAAVSQQIRKLETSLGAALFIRHNRSLTLSEHGKAYFLVVREVLDRLDTVTGQIFPEVEKNVVSVRCTPSVATIWLAPRLREFQRAHPEIDVHIRTIDLLPDQFLTQRCELEILRLPPDTEPLGNMRQLLNAEIFPVCAPDYLERHGPFAGPDAICGQRLIHTLGYSNDWHRWAKAYCSAGVTVPSGLTVDGLNIALDATCQADGIMLGRRPLIETYLADGRLVPALVENLSLYSVYYLQINSKSLNWRAGRILGDWLINKAQAVSG
ncbi:LysR substrate-binding domain-containing protein [Parasedimentitalea psychrophila]|uniref:LysR substrate-binding domain-containing protein n=1 Tax=Parasedimentitalea psychrophila TaxID=2997337 RepID=A0A9Y2P1S4_9RHOB|nr:LysR substrate-binding domain-containing protein [Parasedimentitalea psychrophila]WIY24377.1 LysR substrate-binding domain-containing protein [Parasedimentitalea psychrophila]